MENNKIQPKDYSGFSYDDFLKDDFFIASKTHPTKESDTFWNAFEESDPSNISNYTRAKSFMNHIEQDKKQVGEDDIERLWKRIQNTNKNKSRPVISRKALIISICTAACILGLIISLNYFSGLSKPYSGDGEIMSFVQNRKSENLPQTENIKLILSDQKSIEFKEKESVITYDSTKVNTGHKDVPKNELAAYNQLIVPKGKRSKLVLSDGTKLYLNSGSQLIYPSEFASDKREVYIDGEMYIEVYKDENRPFIVRTSDFNVSVLGTKFNVMAYETDNIKQVVLTEGKVKINSDKHKKDIFLKPSDLFTLEDENQYIEQVNVDNYISWIEGVYNFNNHPLEEIAKHISRYYGINIECGSSISDLPCSGKIDIDVPSSIILEELAYILPVKITKTEDVYYITSK